MLLLQTLVSGSFAFRRQHSLQDSSTQFLDYQSELSLSLSSMLFSFSSNCLFFSLCVSPRLRNKSSLTAAYFRVKHTQFFLFFFFLNLLAFQVAISFYFGHNQVVKISEKNPRKKKQHNPRKSRDEEGPQESTFARPRDF